MFSSRAELANNRCNRQLTKNQLLFPLIKYAISTVCQSRLRYIVDERHGVINEIDFFLLFFFGIYHFFLNGETHETLPGCDFLINKAKDKEWDFKELKN